MVRGDIYRAVVVQLTLAVTDGCYSSTDPQKGVFLVTTFGLGPFLTD